MSTVGCSYAGCTKKFSENRSTAFFKFPVKDKDRCQQWLLRCGNAELLDLEHHKLEYRKLCSDHFDDSCFFDKNYRKKLMKDAVPLQFEDKPEPDFDLEVCRSAGARTYSSAKKRADTCSPELSRGSILELCRVRESTNVGQLSREVGRQLSNHEYDIIQESLPSSSSNDDSPPLEIKMTKAAVPDKKPQLGMNPERIMRLALKKLEQENKKLRGRLIKKNANCRYYQQKIRRLEERNSRLNESDQLNKARLGFLCLLL